MSKETDDLDAYLLNVPPSKPQPQQVKKQVSFKQLIDSKFKELQEMERGNSKQDFAFSRKQTIGNWED